MLKFPSSCLTTIGNALRHEWAVPKCPSDSEDRAEHTFDVSCCRAPVVLSGEATA